MGSHAGCADQDAESVLPGAAGKIPGLVGSAVCGINVYFKWDLKVLQHVDGFLDDGQIAVAAHDDSDFFHKNLLKNKKKRS